MKFDRNGIPTRSGELIWQLTGDGMVIVSPTAGQVRVLNQLGTSIWQLLNGDLSLGEIERELYHQFGHQVETGKIHSDLYQFMAELDRRGMICWASKKRA